MNESTKKWIVSVLKVAAAGATIWAIGLGVLALNPEGEVPESTADVWDFAKFEDSPQKKFARTLENLGHEPPRVYDNNGYTVFFSTRFTHKKPDELVHEYQHAFVAEGVNREMHLTTRGDAAKGSQNVQDAFIKSRAEDMLTGEVMPFTANENYMMMGGGLLRGTPINSEELGRQMDRAAEDNTNYVLQSIEQAYLHCGGDEATLEARAKEVEKSMGGSTPCNGQGQCRADNIATKEKKSRTEALKQLLVEDKEKLVQDCPVMSDALSNLSREVGFAGKMAGYRTIEAFRDPKRGSTSVTAVWTDEDFDVAKAFPEKYGTDSANPSDVPMCRDCQASWNMGGNGREDGFGTTLMHSGDSLGMVEDFYRTKLKEDGWEPVAGDLVLDEIYKRVGNPVPDGRSLRYQRDGEYLRILLGRDKERQRTNITITRSPN